MGGGAWGLLPCSEYLRKALQSCVSGSYCGRHWISRPFVLSLYRGHWGCELGVSQEALLSFHCYKLMGLNGAVTLGEKKKSSFVHLLAGEREPVRNLAAAAALAELETRQESLLYLGVQNQSLPSWSTLSRDLTYSANDKLQHLRVQTKAGFIYFPS